MPAPPGDLGRVIDNRYELCERIGEGGMGVVYRARQVSVDRDVAIKMLHQDAASDPGWVKRFYNEARACSRLEHPNTIRVFDFGQTPEGQLYMVMELLHGESLREALAHGAPFAAERALKILMQCASSLSEAHALGIVHRDIKPDNVFLRTVGDTTDFVKVLDFSVAKLLQDADIRTRAGMVFGTPQYMSPEQGRAQPLDARSDLYALGVVGYEMLTGRVPFADENPLVVLRMHATDPVPPMGAVAAPAAEVILQALEKDPARRFGSATAMKAALERALSTLGAARPSAIQETVRGPGSRVTGAPPSAAQPTVMAPADAFAGTPPPSGSFRGTPPPSGSFPGTPPPSGSFPGAPPPADQPTVLAMDPPARSTSMPAATDDAAPQTLLLQNSEGVVSFLGQARATGNLPATPPPGTPLSPGPGAYPPANAAPPQRAGATFWIICLGCGLGLGLLAYAAVMWIFG